MRLFRLAERYLRTSTLLTISMLKLCLLSLGMIIGMLLPEVGRRIALIVCAIVFVVTYIPLMCKLIGVWKEEKER